MGVVGGAAVVATSHVTGADAVRRAMRAPGSFKANRPPLKTMPSRRTADLSRTVYMDVVNLTWAKKCKEKG